MANRSDHAEDQRAGVLGLLELARRRRDERLVEQYDALRARARAQDLLVVRVRELRKVGVRGSAAWTLLDDGTLIDSWFWDDAPPLDCFLLVRATIRRGSHTDDEVLFVGRGEPRQSGIVAQLPAKVTAAVERLRATAVDADADDDHAAGRRAA